MLLCINRSLAVNGLSKRIDNTTQHTVPNRYLNYPAGGFYLISLADCRGIAKQYRTNVVLFQVHNHAVYISGELKKFALHGIFQTVNTGNAIGNLDYGTNIGYNQLCTVSFDLFFDNRTDFLWFQIQSLVPSFCVIISGFAVIPLSSRRAGYESCNPLPCP